MLAWNWTWTNEGTWALYSPQLLACWDSLYRTVQDRGSHISSGGNRQRGPLLLEFLTSKFHFVYPALSNFVSPYLHGQVTSSCGSQMGHPAGPENLQYRIMSRDTLKRFRASTIVCIFFKWPSTIEQDIYPALCLAQTRNRENSNSLLEVRSSKCTL